MQNASFKQKRKKYLKNTQIAHKSFQLVQMVQLLPEEMSQVDSATCVIPGALRVS